MPASISILQRAVLVGREGTPYSAATLDGTTHGVRDFLEMDFKPDIQRIETRNLAKTTFGPSPAQFDAGGSAYALSLIAPVRKATSAGDKPDISEFLFACGMKETVSAGVSVKYEPQTPLDPNAAQTSTLEVYEAGVKYRMVGSRGTFTLNGSPGSGLTSKFDLRSPFATSTTDTTIPTVPAPSGARLTFAGAAATTEDGSVIDIGTFEFALNAEISKDVGSEGVTIYIVNMIPTFKINPFSVVTVSDWDRLIASTTVAFQADFEQGGSQSMILDIPKANLVETGAEERSGRIARPQTWECIETNGDDAFSLLFL